MKPLRLLYRAGLIFLFLQMTTFLFASTSYNINDSLKLRTFLSSGGNVNLLNTVGGSINLDDPSTYYDVKWTLVGGEFRISSIDWSWDNGLTGYLDLSNCTSMTSLDCSSQSLDSVDISGCTGMLTLLASQGTTQKLNFSGCTSLMDVQCNNLSLVSLNASGCTNLGSLVANANKLVSMDLTGCTKLTQIDCSSNLLTSLDCGGFSVLSALVCKNNHLKTLNLTACSALTSLYCNDNNLSSLDLSTCPNMTSSNSGAWLDCYNNKFLFSGLAPLSVGNYLTGTYAPQDSVILSEATEDGSGNYILDLNNNKYIDLSAEVKPLTAKTSFTWYLTHLGVTSPITLDTIRKGIFKLDKSLFATGDKLKLVMTNADFSKLSGADALTSVSMSLIVPAPKINVNDSTKIRLYFEQANNASSMGVSNLDDPLHYPSVVWKLDTNYEYRISTIDFTWAPAAISGNLNLSACDSLSSLLCPNKQITAVNVSNCAHLKMLNCSVSLITALDASNCPALNSLNCSSGKISSLNVSNSTSLTSGNLNCSNNRLVYSTLPLISQYSSISYAPQDSVILKEASNNAHVLDLDTVQSLDLSSEAKPFAASTIFTWYLTDSGSANAAMTHLATTAPGVFVLDKSLYKTGDRLKLVMTNTDFSALSLTSLSMSLIVPPPAPIYAMNANDSLKIRNFLIQGSNASKLGQTNLDSLRFTTGLSWKLDANSEYRLGDITWDAKNLTGVLDLVGCDSLKTLFVSHDSITSLDLTGCAYLNYLDCSYGVFSNLALVGCTRLATMYSNANNLTRLDLGTLSALKTLYTYNNKLTSLNLSGCTSLTDLECENNKLTILDISTCTKLTSAQTATLSCASNNLRFSSIAPLLTQLSTTSYAPQDSVILKEASNNAHVLDLDTVQSIDLGAEAKPLTASTIFTWYLTDSGSANAAITNVATTAPGVFVLDKSLYKTGDRLKLVMTNTDFSALSLTSLSMSLIVPPPAIYAMNTNDSLKIRNFLIQGSNASKLGQTNLDSLRFTKGLSWKLDANSEYRLSDITWNTKNLTGALDLVGCDSLKTLFVSHNSITSLDLTGCAYLNYLDCSYGAFSNLALVGCTRLVTLYSNNNKLTALDISTCTKLTSAQTATLNCASNNLRFSSIAPLLTQLSTTSYAPQDTLVLAESINEGNGNYTLNLNNTLSIDLSAEAKPITALTTFAWSLTHQGNIKPISLFQSSPGIFILDKSLFTAGDVLQLSLSNTDFPGFGFHPLMTSKMSIILAPPTMSTNDSIKLRSFLNQGTNALKLGVNNLDSLKVCSGVNWVLGSDNQFRISSINWPSKTLIGDLDLSNCDSLNDLVCINNALTSLNIDGCKALKDLDCSTNDLLYSSLTSMITNFSQGLYAPQNTVVLKEQSKDKNQHSILNLDDVKTVDMSAEVKPLDSLTSFVWALNRSGELSNISLVQTSPGVFVMDTSVLQNGDLLQLIMTNGDFPELSDNFSLKTVQLSIVYTKSVPNPDTIPNTSTESLNAQADPLAIYPNPSHSHITINTSGEYQWTIYNSLGYISQRGIGYESTNIKFDLPHGLYFIRISKNGKVSQVRKLLIIK